jgi:hypothetical protein
METSVFPPFVIAGVAREGPASGLEDTWGSECGPAASGCKVHMRLTLRPRCACPSQADRRRKDDQVRATIMQKLVETGEKER